MVLYSILGMVVIVELQIVLTQEMKREMVIMHPNQVGETQQLNNPVFPIVVSATQNTAPGGRR